MGKAFSRFIVFFSAFCLFQLVSTFPENDAFASQARQEVVPASRYDVKVSLLLDKMSNVPISHFGGCSIFKGKKQVLKKFYEPDQLIREKAEDLQVKDKSYVRALIGTYNVEKTKDLSLLKLTIYWWNRSGTREVLEKITCRMGRTFREFPIAYFQRIDLAVQRIKGNKYDKCEILPKFK